MGGLFGALQSSARALGVYGRALSVVENNITNAHTPGYVRQELELNPLPFDPGSGQTGGVVAGPLLSARSEFLEQTVRNQQQRLGSAQQKAGDLAQVETIFDLTSSSGIAGALSKLFTSFSQLSVNPHDASSRQAVIDQARVVAQSFHDATVRLAEVWANVDQSTRGVVAEVNRLTQKIAAINALHRGDAASSGDAGLDANLHAALEELSGLADFTLVRTEDGAFNVYLGGQTPLVVGDHAFNIDLSFASGQTALLDSQANDITAQITEGRLGGLLEEKNRLLPGYLGDLNTLAQALADNVNTLLSQGVDQNGVTPSLNLFSYGLPDAAFTLGVTGITPDQIAAALPSAPGGNGNAIALARLGVSPAVNGFSFIQFFGNLGARVGLDSSNARQDQSQDQDLLAQARQFRSDATSVSLNEEAAKLLQFQQAYQAVGKLVSVLDGLTQTVIELIH